MMLNKTFYLLLLSLIPLLGFSQANSQYPDSGNKIRLGFQTSGDGLIWRDTQPKVAGYQPINNKAAWIVLDTVNNKFYHYKQSNNTWNLAGQDIDTANLIATKYNLGFKLSLADTQNMLTPYWRSGRFSGTLPVANGGTNASTFTEGSVVFAGTSGTYTQDNSGLFFNNTNNRLGINTASPLGLLEARSTVGGTNNGLFSLYENSGTSPYFTFQKARGTVASPSNVQLNDGMGDLTFSGYAYSDFNAAVVLRAYNYLAPGAAYLNGGFKILINSQANGGLVEYLNIISNGNTAIGDNLTPTERLHVGGNARITGSVTATRFNANTTESGISSQYGSTNATNSYVSYIYNNSNIAYLGNGTSLFSGVNATDFGITTAISSNLIFGTNNLERMSILSGGAIRFKGINTTANLNALFENSSSALNFFSTEGSGTTKDIGFYNSGSGGLGVIILKANGNVGIGTTSPGYKLHIEGPSATLTIADATSYTQGVGGKLLLNGNYRSVGDITEAGYIKASKVNSTNNDFGFDMIFATSNYPNGLAERMRITSTGNVGIGRTPTTNALEVNGDASKTTVGSWAANSDSTIKTEIHTIEGALDRINKVRLVSFKYKDDYKFLNPSIKDKFYQNVIAQEFQKIYPDYVYQSGDIFEGKNILQVDTNPMYIDAVASIQELSILLQELQSQINILKQEIINLKNK